MDTFNFICNMDTFFWSKYTINFICNMATFFLSKYTINFICNMATFFLSKYTINFICNMATFFWSRDNISINQLTQILKMISQSDIECDVTYKNNNVSLDKHYHYYHNSFYWTHCDTSVCLDLQNCPYSISLDKSLWCRSFITTFWYNEFYNHNFQTLWRFTKI